MSPDNEKGGSGLTRNPPSASVTTKSNDIPTIQARTDKRTKHEGQTSLPIVPALAFPPSPGLKMAVLIVEHCPRCGWPHRHESGWPTGTLLAKRARCGEAYQLVPYVRRAKRRAA